MMCIKRIVSLYRSEVDLWAIQNSGLFMMFIGMIITVCVIDSIFLVRLLDAFGLE